MSTYNRGFRDDNGVWHPAKSNRVKRDFRIFRDGDEAFALFSRGKRVGFLAADLRTYRELTAFLKAKGIYRSPGKERNTTP